MFSVVLLHRESYIFKPCALQVDLAVQARTTSFFLATAMNSISEG